MQLAIKGYLSSPKLSTKCRLLKTRELWLHLPHYESMYVCECQCKGMGLQENRQKRTFILVAFYRVLAFNMNANIAQSMLEKYTE